MRLAVAELAACVLIAGIGLTGPTPVDSERDWCDRLADEYGAQVEVQLWDDTRCDLVTETEAIEVDWAAKWAEAIGQAQYYGLVLRRQPAVILLVTDMERQRRYVYRCQTVCARLGMPLYVEEVR